jgi:hypothetical protein
MNLKKLFGGLLTLFVISSCTHRPVSERTPANAIKPRHLIVTLHGVRGTEKSFGLEFHKIIKNHLETVDPNYEVRTINYTYLTGQDDHHPVKMKEGVNKAILAEMNGYIGDYDKISVLGYSMGGQVMAHWYFNTIFDERYSRIAEKTVNLIGLGAAFWGSLNASFGKNLLTSLGVNVDKAAKIIQMSGNELRSLSAVSDAIADLRAKMVEWRENPALRQRFKPKIFSIAGLIPCLDQIVPGQPGCGAFKSDISRVINENINLNLFFSGLARWETDMMVIVPSARLDFIYYRDTAESRGSVSAREFKVMESPDQANTRFLPVDALHASDIAFIEDKVDAVYDVVIVPKKCMDPKKCDQKTYKYMFEALAGCKEVGSTCNKATYQKFEDDLFQASSGEKKLNRDQTWQEDWKVSEQLHAFFIELHLKFPEGYEFPMGETPDEGNLFKYIRFNFDNNIYLKDDYAAKDYPKMAAQRLMFNGTAKTNVSEIAKVQVGRSFQLQSKQVEYIRNADGQLTGAKIGLSGRFIPGTKMDLSNENQQQKFFETIWKGNVVAPFTVGLPGLKPRDIYPIIRPTASTYIDLTLSK